MGGISSSLLVFLGVLVGVMAQQDVLQASRVLDKILVANDDGWAVAQIRAEYDALKAAGYNVILSAPAENQSGRGALQVSATPRTEPCEFDSCPANSGPTGFNASDPRLNWINAFPADAAQFGIEVVAPRFFGGPPDLVVSGPNVGSNIGLQVFFSGTVGAAGKAVHLGVPAIAFSSVDGSTAQEAWTVPTSPTVLSAETYATLTTKLLAVLFSQPPASPPLLPAGIVLNVNFPATSDTCTADTMQWVLTRVFSVFFESPDVVTCKNGGRLPKEGDVVAAGCLASVSVIDATTKLDASSGIQADVLQRLDGLGFVCFPN
ncbi:uncharacterized protein PHACADRAFT_176642 [Phanerochaete carnosa HHB-10118-sp]|uniref:Survival protein SurE-like phosphatase/nucleotidase domain-containing protein n=1 Tax=Phanerochaete carnosa (strain HHB-10118-sp) TaxID=650164 RepID=K5W137_PHACS|nr:uncharacterized protein PHACADRAFT_176642 [Phanerochaete carnosa HHB-10118-sp]EKM52614.1 hypothetical protein PHACADRAFT_176642 [Phanerochaete carnosa HHB-10118-sp]